MLGEEEKTKNTRIGELLSSPSDVIQYLSNTSLNKLVFMKPFYKLKLYLVIIAQQPIGRLRELLTLCSATI